MAQRGAPVPLQTAARAGRSVSRTKTEGGAGANEKGMQEVQNHTRGPVRSFRGMAQRGAPVSLQTAARAGRSVSRTKTEGGAGANEKGMQEVQNHTGGPRLRDRYEK